MNDLRIKKPGKARRADYQNSRAAAIDLKCEDCCGGSLNEAKKCEVYTCFLWPYGPAGKLGERPHGAIPSLEAYNTLLPELTEEQKAECRSQFAAKSAEE